VSWRFAVLAMILAPPVTAQTPVAGIGLYFPDTTRTTWRLGVNQPVLGPLGLGLYGTLIQGRDGQPNAWGAEGDLSLFRGGTGGPYVLGSLGGGAMPSDNFRGWWTWSVGAGWDLYPFHGLTIALEGRWRLFHPGDKRGAELGIRLGFGGGDQPPAAPSSSSAAASTPTGAGAVPLSLRAGTVSARDELITSVIRTARDEMGAPYKWGGQGDEGFDCSGLIRYSYGREGIDLPRRSVDQAQAGAAVERSLEALLPGDILTFRSSSKGPVSHVGLYLGDGKFIHSANGGVQESTLSADDPYGKWWWQRWAGARRIVAVPNSQ
jgi:cell wall-associated NlpC family hydrolase